MYHKLDIDYPLPFYLKQQSLRKQPLKFTINEIKQGLENYQVPKKRLNVIELSNESILIDDTVNANPQSAKAAIDVLSIKVR